MYSGYPYELRKSVRWATDCVPWELSLWSFDWLEPFQSLSNWGLFGIFLWGILENGILPVPLELLVIPFILATGSSATVVALLGAAGATIGGLLDYYVGVEGRRLFPKLSARMIDRAASSLKRYERFGKSAIYVALFAGRLAPTSLKPVLVIAGSTRLNQTHFCIIVFVSSLIRYYIAATIGGILTLFLR